VDPATRSRAKAINCGLAYGMNAWGLASRLVITADEAQEFIDSYFATFRQIRDYLDRAVARAATEGFTESILGRRRYIPELQASNPRVRDIGRRMALNAPIQGSAADVFKLGMIGVDRALLADPGPRCRDAPHRSRLAGLRGSHRARRGRRRAFGTGWRAPTTCGCRFERTSGGAPAGPTPSRPATDAVARRCAASLRLDLEVVR